MNNKAKHQKDKKITKKRVILFILELILIGVMIFAGIRIYNWWQENNKSKEILDNISDDIKIEETEEEKKYVVDFESLKEKNSDTVAWIKIENTNIEYPIVKAKDNEYYLNRSFDKTYNSAGWLFMDYRNKADGTDKNTVIYGHNRKDDSMFGTLKNAIKDEWYDNEKNKTITYITENEYSKYEIFSAYRIEEEDYYITTGFKNDEEFDKFVKRLKARSFKNLNVEVSGSDQILTLSTCSNAGYRVAVHAKKIVE